MKPAPKIPYGGKATAIFGLVLIAIFWIGTAQRSATELSEAIESESATTPIWRWRSASFEIW